MTQVFAAGDTLSAESKLVLSAGKGENDAVDPPQVFGVGKLGGTKSRDTPLAGPQSMMNDNLSKDFDRITDLGKARSDE